jgi:hypothetical protein
LRDTAHRGQALAARDFEARTTVLGNALIEAHEVNRVTIE